MFTMTVVIAFIVLCSIKTNETTTLENEDYNQKLYLYTDGSCVAITEYYRLTGNYDLRNGICYIEWDNGEEQQGDYVYACSDVRKVKSVTIEGVTFSRKVVCPSR